MRKIYVVGPSVGYARWMEGELVENMEEADLVVFTGGADINPSIYGANVHKTTHYNDDRDTREIEAYNKAVSLEKPIWGTCRGLQLIGALNGATLIQDLHHPYKHRITTIDGESMKVNSIHHQLVNPYNLPKEDYLVLGWADNLSDYHLDGDDNNVEMPNEAEIIYFPKTKCLGAQFHPEMMDVRSPIIGYLRRLLTDLLNNTIINDENTHEEKIVQTEDSF